MSSQGLPSVEHCPLLAKHSAAIDVVRQDTKDTLASWLNVRPLYHDMSSRKEEEQTPQGA